MKRTLIIAGIIIAIIAIVVLIYFLFFRGGATPGPGGTGEFPVAGDGTGGQGATEIIDDKIDASTQPVLATPRLIKITNGPVALGIIALTEASATGTPALGSTSTSTAPTTPDTLVRYIERASGNMYEYRASTRAITRLTNRTVPGATEASWLSDGSVAFLRYLSTDSAGGKRHIETYALEAKTGNGHLFARDLGQVVGNGMSVVAVSSGTNGSVAVRSSWDGTNPATLFTSSISRLFAFPTSNGIYVQTPAAAKADSYVFLASGSSLQRVPTPSRGLTALPSLDGKSILVSYVEGGIVQLAKVSSATNELKPLPVATLTEKCAWSPDGKDAYCGVPTSFPQGTYPDDWYQGAVGFKDRLWDIDFESQVAVLAADLPALTDTAIDAVSLSVDADRRVLFFVNRLDGSLWAYSL